jgi:hypothetical protein
LTAISAWPSQLSIVLLPKRAMSRARLWSRVISRNPSGVFGNPHETGIGRGGFRYGDAEHEFVATRSRIAMSIESNRWKSGQRVARREVQIDWLLSLFAVLILVLAIELAVTYF